MRLTPLDIQSHRFSRRLNGVDGDEIEVLAFEEVSDFAADADDEADADDDADADDEFAADDADETATLRNLAAELAQSAAPQIEAEVARAAFRHFAEEAVGPADAAEDLPPDDTDDPALAAFLDDGARIDQEALRRLVLDIVREELQGRLGERITRNVRKLVRREIMRVLNAQDID